MTSLIGATIGGYEIKEQLGQGGMGAVFLAEKDGTLPVALKVLKMSQVDALDSACKRFIDEATAATAIESEHLVPILASGADGTYGPYIVYQYIPGGSLRQRINELGKLSQEEVLDKLAPALLKALEDLHDCEVCHRDVKPENILYDDKGRYLLGDLGLATFEGRQAKTRTGTFVGTPGYMAPERINGEQGGDEKSADIYAAAVVIVEAVTGKSPFRAKSPIEVVKEQLTRSFKRRELTKLGVPAQMAAVLTKALSLDPLSRPKNCSEFLKELHTDVSQSAVRTQVNVKPAETKVSKGSPKRFYPALAALFALLFVCHQLYVRRQAPQAIKPSLVASPANRIAQWTKEIETFKRTDFANERQIRRVRDIHRSFHRLLKGSRPKEQAILDFECKLLHRFYVIGLAETYLLANVELESAAFLYSLHQRLRQEPNWTACWHLHLLLRYKNAIFAKAELSKKHIKAALENNLLQEWVTPDLMGFIKICHAEFELAPPKSIGYKKRMKQLRVFHRNINRKLDSVKLVGKDLDSRGLNVIPSHRVNNLDEIKASRDKFCERLLRYYWESKPGFSTPVFTFGSLTGHLRALTELLRVRSGITKRLLANPDFQWGPNFSERYLLDEVLVKLQAVALQSHEVEKLSRWVYHLEIYEGVRNLLRTLGEAERNSFKEGLIKRVIPYFPPESAMSHMLKVLIRKLDIIGKRHSQASEVYNASLIESRKAFELTMVEFSDLETIAPLLSSHWTALRRVLDVHLTMMKSTNAKEDMRQTVDELERFIAKHENSIGERTVWALRNLRLHSAIVKATLELLEGNELSKQVRKTLKHAQDNPKKYDDGPPKDAIILLNREKYR